MERGDRPSAPRTSEKLILDAGAVIALARGKTRARDVLARAIAARFEVLVPAVVVAETVRGDGARDAPVNRVLAMVHGILPLEESIARSAGRLLGVSGSDATIDAIVVASVVRLGGGSILTDDVEDYQRLCRGHNEIVLLRV
jgi:predicted nucleic acid-binding protein